MKFNPITAFRRAAIELAIVFLAVIFVRKEQYWSPTWLMLDWQQITVCAIGFIDGFIGSMSQPGNFTSPFRKKVLRWIMPAALFLYISCAALSKKLHVLPASEELQIFGLVLSIIGLGLYVWSRRTAMLQVIAVPYFDIEEKEKASAVGSVEDADQSRGVNMTSADNNPDQERATHGVAPTDEPPVVDSDQNIDYDPIRIADEVSETRHESLSASEIPPSRETGSESQEQPAAAPDPSGNNSATTADQPFVARGPWLVIRYPDRSALILVLAGQALLLGSWLPWFALPGVLIGMKWEIADIESFRISQFGARYIEYRKHSWTLVPFLF